MWTRMLISAMGRTIDVVILMVGKGTRITGIGRLASTSCRNDILTTGFVRLTSTRRLGPSFGPLSGTDSEGGGAAVCKLVERAEAPPPSRNRGDAIHAEDDVDNNDSLKHPFGCAASQGNEGHTKSCCR